MRSEPERKDDVQYPSEKAYSTVIGLAEDDLTASGQLPEQLTIEDLDNGAALEAKPPFLKDRRSFPQRKLLEVKQTSGK